MSTTVRKQAPRLARPVARYWKGKAPKGVKDATSDSDSDEGPQLREDGDISIYGERDLIEKIDDGIRISEPIQAAKKIGIILRDVEIKEGKVVESEYEEDGDEEDEEDEEEDEEGDEEGEGENPSLQFRPVFVPK
jgi:microfibrillar-associated protein 1